MEINRHFLAACTLALALSLAGCGNPTFVPGPGGWFPPGATFGPNYTINIQLPHLIPTHIACDPRGKETGLTVKVKNTGSYPAGSPNDSSGIFNIEVRGSYTDPSNPTNYIAFDQTYRAPQPPMPPGAERTFFVYAVPVSRPGTIMVTAIVDPNGEATWPIGADNVDPKVCQVPPAA